MAWDSASPFLTTLPALPNGIPSSIAGSGKSAGTEQPSLWSYEKALKFIRTAATTTGLQVTCRHGHHLLPNGVEVSKQEIAQLFIWQKRVLPKMELHDLAAQQFRHVALQEHALQRALARPASPGAYNVFTTLSSLP
jgi:hypothetical protein